MENRLHLVNRMVGLGTITEGGSKHVEFKRSGIFAHGDFSRAAE